MLHAAISHDYQMLHLIEAFSENFNGVFFEDNIWGYTLEVKASFT